MKNLIERMVIFSSSEVLTLQDVPQEMKGEFPAPERKESRELPYLDLTMLEREAITKALKETNGNKTQAAKVLGIGLRTLHRKLIEYELKDDERSQ